MHGEILEQSFAGERRKLQRELLGGGKPDDQPATLPRQALPNLMECCDRQISDIDPNRTIGRTHEVFAADGYGVGPHAGA